jgi:hypothetical protein
MPVCDSSDGITGMETESKFYSCSGTFILGSTYNLALAAYLTGLGLASLTQLGWGRVTE